MNNFTIPHEKWNLLATQPFFKLKVVGTIKNKIVFEY